MPLHRIYYPKDAFSEDDKRQISENLTALYTRPPINIPAFYVIVIFIPLDAENIWLEACFAPFIKERGLDWEFHIEEVERDLWIINGMVAPMPGTEAEKMWIDLNKAVPYEGMPRVGQKF
ncbi:hypothetical protein BZG36_02358 [Bifiguratus adelaidae]|uniref:Tautomerase cis-CaaD-like domain-containing protein n=1 Tax=Bifiguratus adelaidae TaxID=1938954 RepID=A0A261Y2G3_9FUNG|nr:hypothetical protein BZG36_02358 [Bifiguratus adelaidae]